MISAYRRTGTASKRSNGRKESMPTLELCAKLESVAAGDTATLFFKDGETIRGGMLYNSTQQRGVIIDPGTETQRRFEASEVSKVWRR